MEFQDYCKYKLDILHIERTTECKICHQMVLEAGTKKKFNYSEGKDKGRKSLGLYLLDQ